MSLLGAFHLWSPDGMDIIQSFGKGPETDPPLLGACLFPGLSQMRVGEEIRDASGHAVLAHRIASGAGLGILLVAYAIGMRVLWCIAGWVAGAARRVLDSRTSRRENGNPTPP